jgi:hypothetical protein
MELGRSGRSMMMTSASASGGAASLSYGVIDAEIAKFCSNYGRALGYALAGLRRSRLGKISGIWQRYPSSLWTRARIIGKQGDC